MRCPDCNKFVANDEQDPEVNNVEVDGYTVRAEVRIVNACADCGTELTETTFELEDESAFEAMKAHVETKHKADALEPEDYFEVEEGSCERTGRSGYFKGGKFVNAGGRYAKTFYGVSLEVSVKC